MEDTQTAELEAKNQVENDNSSNESNSTVEDAGIETPSVDDAKQEEDDFKAQLEKAKQLVAHKEEIISQKNRAIEALKKDKEEESDGDYSFETRLAEVQKKNEDELNRFKISVVSDTIDEEVSKLAKSPAEAELIKFHLENSVKFDYTKAAVRDAVKTAWLKANEKKIISTNKELANTIASRATLDTNATVSGQRVANKSSNYTAAEKKFLQRYGVKET